MQKDRDEVSSLTSNTYNLKEEIKTRFFQPFIQCLENSDQNKQVLIQRMFRNLQLTNTDINQTSSEEKKAKYLNQRLSEQLTENSGLQEIYVKIAAVYLDKKTQQQEFPNCDGTDIQSIIRELFHDYINPLPYLQIDNIDTKSVSEGLSRYPEDSFFSNASEVQFRIASYLDYKSVKSFRQTCKSAYLILKTLQERRENVFYIIGGEVKITRPPKWHEPSNFFLMRKNIPSKETIDSLLDINLTEVKLFRSSYQAIQYLHFLQHGGSVYESNPGFIPSLWVATYIGDPRDLMFTTERIVTYRLLSNGSYECSHHSITVDHATVPKASIYPLRGTVLFSTEFAAYNILNTVHFQLPNQNEMFSRKCIMM